MSTTLNTINNRNLDSNYNSNKTLLNISNNNINYSDIINNIKKGKLSKYDMIKITVHIQNNSYTFSRYLLSNYLKIIKIPEEEADNIAYDTKRYLIDNCYEYIKSDELNKILFKIMENYNYNSKVYKQRYSVITKFYMQRTPLIILIAGAPMIGKTYISNLLSEKLNISNVLQTKVVNLVIKALKKESLHNDNTKDIFKIENSEEFIASYYKQCLNVRKGCDFDIQKAYSEGKSVILEGYDLLPSYFLHNICDKKELIVLKHMNYLESNNITNNIKCSQNLDKGLIIPFLLKTDDFNYELFLNNNLIDNSKNIKLINKFKIIQSILEKNKNLINILNVNYNKLDEVANDIHNCVLDRIDKYFN